METGAGVSVRNEAFFCVFRARDDASSLMTNHLCIAAWEVVVLFWIPLPKIAAASLLSLLMLPPQLLQMMDDHFVVAEEEEQEEQDDAGGGDGDDYDGDDATTTCNGLTVRHRHAVRLFQVPCGVCSPTL